MVKITSKLYRPADLLAVINVMEKVLGPNVRALDVPNIVIDLRKMGYKIVKVDDPKWQILDLMLALLLII